MVALFPARQAATGVRKIIRRGIVGGADAALRALHQRCVGCGTQGRPGRSGRPNLRYERWGNRRRGTRRRGAVTAIEWRTVRPEPQAVVRSTLPEARAVMLALVRTRLHGAVRSEVRAWSAGAPARVQRALREAPARGERGGGSNDAVERCAGGGGSARGGERSEPPGKRSAQRPKGAEARGIPARRGETAQRARQGSPVAKRRAQPHRMAHRTGIRPRHRHQHHCLHRRQHPSHRDRPWQRHQHQRRHRRARDIVVERGETVKTLALSLVKRRVREVVRRKSGGAAAERGAAGDARSEGGPCGWRRRSGPTKEKGRAAEATRPVVAMRATRRPAAPGFRAGGLCRRGSR